MWRRLWRTASAVPWNHLSPSSVCSAAMIETKRSEKMSNLYVRLMCWFRLSELNCVRTKMRPTSEFKQFEMGMSIRRYLPAMGTAGFERRYVSGKSRVPRPPPRMMASRSLSIVHRVSHVGGGSGSASVVHQETIGAPGQEGAADSRISVHRTGAPMVEIEPLP